MPVDMIYSYDPHSESAKRLSDELDVRMIKHTESKFKGGPRKTVLNWGSSDLPREVRKCEVINEENAVSNAINKLRSFRLFREHGVRTVPFTESRQEAQTWVGAGYRVFARTRLEGKDGEGLIEANPNEPLPEARLYTRFIEAVREYRIMVCFGNVTSRQRKVVLDDFQGRVDPHIKTSGNGYGFKWVTRGIPEDVEQQSIAAVDALGLDFGGVDVLWDGNGAYVLEVNTAPELTPRACTALGSALKPQI